MLWETTVQQVWYGLSNGMGYAVFAMGLALIFGVVGVINFAHGELYMLGPVLIWPFMMYLGMNFWVAAVVSIIAILILAFIINRLAVETVIGISPLMVILSSLAVSLMLLHGSIAIWGTTVLPIEFPFVAEVKAGAVNITSQRIMLFVGGGMLISGIQLFLAKSKMGKLIRATAQNTVGAQLAGINIRRVYAFTFMLASAMAALAGILLAPVWFTQTQMGQQILIRGFVLVIVAGMGNIMGCVAVGLAMGVIEALFGQFVSIYFRMVFIYLVMITLLVLKPKGLFARRF